MGGGGDIHVHVYVVRRRGSNSHWSFDIVSWLLFVYWPGSWNRGQKGRISMSSAWWWKIYVVYVGIGRARSTVLFSKTHKTNVQLFG